jgi:hypothetical protein
MSRLAGLQYELSLYSTQDIRQPIPVCSDLHGLNDIVYYIKIQFDALLYIGIVAVRRIGYI